MTSHQPWFKLWAMDELFAGPIRAATLPTQAVYMRLMAVAHQSEPYGLVEPAGKRGMERTARLACVSLDELQDAWAEMEELQIVRDGRLVFSRLQEDREELEDKRRRAKRSAAPEASVAPATAPKSAPDLRSNCAPAAPQLRENCAATAPKSAPDLRSGCAQISDLRSQIPDPQIPDPPSPPDESGGGDGPSRGDARIVRGARTPATDVDDPDVPRCPGWSAADPEFWALLRRRGVTTRASGDALGPALAAMVAEHPTVAGHPYAAVAPALWAYVEANASVWSPKALVRYAESVLTTCRVRNVLPGVPVVPAWEREEMAHAKALEEME